eukprot:g225.t1
MPIHRRGSYRYSLKGTRRPHKQSIEETEEDKGKEDGGISEIKEREGTLYDRRLETLQEALKITEKVSLGREEKKSFAMVTENVPTPEEQAMTIVEKLSRQKRKKEKQKLISTSNSPEKSKGKRKAKTVKEKLSHFFKKQKSKTITQIVSQRKAIRKAFKAVKEKNEKEKDSEEGLNLTVKKEEMKEPVTEKEVPQFLERNDNEEDSFAIIEQELQRQAPSISFRRENVKNRVAQKSQASVALLVNEEKHKQETQSQWPIISNIIQIGHKRQDQSQYATKAKKKKRKVIETINAKEEEEKLTKTISPNLEPFIAVNKFGLHRRGSFHYSLGRQKRTSHLSSPTSQQEKERERIKPENSEPLEEKGTQQLLSFPPPPPPLADNNTPSEDAAYNDPSPPGIIVQNDEPPGFLNENKMNTFSLRLLSKKSGGSSMKVNREAKNVSKSKTLPKYLIEKRKKKQPLPPPLADNNAPSEDAAYNDPSPPGIIVQNDEPPGFLNENKMNTFSLRLLSKKSGGSSMKVNREAK